MLPKGRLPNICQVRGSNYCDIGLAVDERTGRVMALAAIDNLVKGAAGQALQNMNLMLGCRRQRFADSPGLPLSIHAGTNSISTLLRAWRLFMMCLYVRAGNYASCGNRGFFDRPENLISTAKASRGEVAVLFFLFPVAQRTLSGPGHEPSQATVRLLPSCLAASSARSARLISS